MITIARSKLTIRVFNKTGRLGEEDLQMSHFQLNDGAKQ